MGHFLIYGIDILEQSDAFYIALTFIVIVGHISDCNQCAIAFEADKVFAAGSNGNDVRPFHCFGKLAEPISHYSICNNCTIRF